MIPIGPRRSLLMGGVVALWLVGIAVIFGTYAFKRETVVISHWANGHMAAASLLPTFARDFNAAQHITQSGKVIEVRPVEVNSGAITCQLIRRVKPGAGCPENEGTGGQDADKHPDPVIVTPAADHWLGEVNHVVGRDVIDIGTTRSLAKTYIGIATLREMAQCLGWPEREIGLSDVIALRANPQGWGSCATARAEWGRTPLISFTDPDSSSTGRSMVFTLFSLAAGKSPDQLTRADVSQPQVLDYVRRFQRGVDHYVPDTLILNSKIYLGPRYGHFFLIAEDNLVKLYQGKVEIEDVAGRAGGASNETWCSSIRRKDHPVTITRRQWSGRTGLPLTRPMRPSNGSTICLQTRSNRRSCKKASGRAQPSPMCGQREPASGLTPTSRRPRLSQTGSSHLLHGPLSNLGAPSRSQVW